MNIRKIAFRILKNFEHVSYDLDALIDQNVRGITIEHRDRRFLFELVYGVIRRRLTLDFYIDNFVAEKASRDDEDLRNILRLGIYQLIYLDKVPSHAAVNESVELTKISFQTRKYSGLVNAVLRNVIQSKHTIPLPDPQVDLAERLSIEFSHPKWMIKRWLKNFGLSKAKKLLTFNNEKPSIYLRRKIQQLPKQVFESEVRTICDAATGFRNLFYKLKGPFTPDTLRIVQRGLCVVQSPASGWAVAALDVEPGDRLLDMCSAPGGKTSLLSDLTTDKGSVCACELKWDRLKKVRDLIRRMDLRNVFLVACDATQLPFEGQFDKILLDAPCSGTGVLQKHPDGRWLKQEDNIETLAKLQASLLDSASKVLIPGGTLVYSTCSLEPEENELQIEKFLETHKDFYLEKLPDSIPAMYSDSHNFLKITPYEHGLDGMFAARLKRKL